MPGDGNGASRLGLWLSIGASAVVLVATMGTMLYGLLAMAYEVHGDTVRLDHVQEDARLTDDQVRSLQLKINTLEVALNEIETHPVLRG